ncbi:MAG: transcriptional repressor [Clostridia bacterium]|nr:transcriptional repressor [Clostridia bacterium]
MESQSGYKTKQKELIEQCAAKMGASHFTADEICEMLDTCGTHVGKATVYRHLERMLAEGAVRKYSIDGKSGACYQYAGGAACEHFHLKCTLCGKLIHAQCSFLDRLSSHVEYEHNFKIDGSRTVFYGVCGECAGVDISGKPACRCKAHL